MTSKGYKVEISIRAGRKAGSVYYALAPDMKKLQTRNERIRMSLQGSVILFSMSTHDISSLRANVNSYLRLTDASLKCIDN